MILRCRAGEGAVVRREDAAGCMAILGEGTKPVKELEKPSGRGRVAHTWVIWLRSWSPRNKTSDV